MMGAFGLFAVVVTVSFQVKADPPAARVVLSLREAQLRAERASPGVEAARHRVLAARAQLDEAWRAPFSTVSVTGFLSLSPTARGNPTYSPDAFGQNPFDNGLGVIGRLSVETAIPISPWTHLRLGEVRDAARANIRASEAEVRKARLELLHTVRRAYFGLQFARDVLYLLNRSRGWLEQADQQLQSQQGDGGASSLNDARQLRMYREEVRARTAQMRQAEHVASATLGWLSDTEGADVPEAPLCVYEGEIGPLVTYLTRARLNRPEVEQLRQGLAARRAAVAIQQWAYLPDVGLGLSASFATASTITQQTNPFAANNNNFAFWGAGLVLRWNLDALTNHARVSRLREELAMTEAQERLALGAIAIDVTNVYEQVVAAQEREAAYNSAERDGSAWFTSVFTSYQSGVGEASTLITPLREYLQARFNHLQATHDLAVARSQLAMVTGVSEMEGTAAGDCVVSPVTPAPEPDAGAPPSGEEDEIERLLRESAQEAGDAGVATQDATGDSARRLNDAGGAPRRGGR